VESQAAESAEAWVDAAQANRQAENAEPLLRKFEDQTVKILQDFVAEKGGVATRSHMTTHLAMLGPQKLCAALQLKYNSHPADAVRKAFAVFDKDGNGLLEAGEIKAVVDVMFPTTPQSIRDAKLQFCGAADENADGKIGMAEFLDIFWPAK
jgi:hypothetical protein